MNGQSKTSSFVESLANIAAGIAIALVLTHVMLRVPLAVNVELTALLTLVSLVRQFVIRRLFNYFTTRKTKERDWVKVGDFCGRELGYYKSYGLPPRLGTRDDS